MIFQQCREQCLISSCRYYSRIGDVALCLDYSDKFTGGNVETVCPTRERAKIWRRTWDFVAARITSIKFTLRIN